MVHYLMFVLTHTQKWTKFDDRTRTRSSPLDIVFYYSDTHIYLVLYLLYREIIFAPNFYMCNAKFSLLVCLEIEFCIIVSITRYTLEYVYTKMESKNHYQALTSPN